MADDHAALYSIGQSLTFDTPTSLVGLCFVLLQILALLSLLALRFLICWAEEAVVIHHFLQTQAYSGCAGGGVARPAVPANLR